MSKKRITMAAGLASLIGLSSAYAALKSYNNKQAEMTALEQGKQILNVDSNSVTGLTFTVDHEQVSFILKNDVWIKEDDETFPVDEEAILGPLVQLAPLNAVRTLENVEDSAEYGINEPQNTITLTDKDGGQTEIVIGATNSGTGDDYIMVNGEESVIYTVSSALRTAFSDDLYDYAVSEELPHLNASEITRISLQRDTDAYEVYLEDAKWKISGSDSEVLDADSEKVNNVLTKLSGLEYADYVEHDCKDPSRYGLDDPSAILTVTWTEETESDTEDSTESVTEAQSKTEVSFVFRIGNTDELGNYYVQQEKSSQVHTISSGIIGEVLEKSISDWETAEDTGA